MLDSTLRMQLPIWLAIFFFSPHHLFASKDICDASLSISEYILSIPDSMLQVADDNVGTIPNKQLNRYFNVVDKKNGYVQIKDSRVIPTVTFALFRLKDRQPLLAVTQDGFSVQSRDTFLCTNGKWVSTSSFPEISADFLLESYRKAGITALASDVEAKNGSKDKEIPLTRDRLMAPAHSLYRLQLPRKGREILALASHPDLREQDFDKRIFTLRFQDQKFIIVSPSI